MKTNRILLVLAAASLFGCQNRAAIQALQELTGKLAETAKQQSVEIADAANVFETCKTDLAKVTRKKAEPRAEATIEIPAAPTEATVAALEAYKGALTNTIDQQKAQIDELKKDGETCVTDLAAARKKRAAARASAHPAATPKPTAVKQAEQAGTATKGVHSRYKTKQ